MPITVGTDSANTRRTLSVQGQTVAYYSIKAAEEAGLGSFARLPAVLKVVLENMLRFEDGKTVTQDDIRAFSDWAAQGGQNPREIAYRPARVLLQDFTGVPAVVDLAAMRSGVVKHRRRPREGQPARALSTSSSTTPSWSTSIRHRLPRSLQSTWRIEFERNRRALRVPQVGPAGVRQLPRRAPRHRHRPPGQPGVPRHRRGRMRTRTATTGGLPRLPGRHRQPHHHGQRPGRARLGRGRHRGRGGDARPADLHADPRGHRLRADRQAARRRHRHRPGAARVEMLRAKGVVGKFVEFYGPGLADLPLADRATIANMAPEYGATCGFFPVDDEDAALSPLTGRDEKRIELVERLLPRPKACGATRANRPSRSSPTRCSLDMARLSPRWPGPKRPQDRVDLAGHEGRRPAQSFAK